MAGEAAPLIHLPTVKCELTIHATLNCGLASMVNKMMNTRNIEPTIATLTIILFQ